MKFDIFLSICQTEVDGHTPSEKQMWLNFFDQVKLADQLGFGVAWVAETHLSCQTQKQNPGAVIPEFKGEIGLNTDILQVAHKVFSMTKNIEVGSAIRNIQCNGGPIANAEAIKTFLSLHGLNEEEKRRLHIGFAAGRFPFSNTPYLVKPRNAMEEKAWPVLKNKIFQECTEIFLRLLNGEELDSTMVRPKTLKESDFRSKEDWEKVQTAWLELSGKKEEDILVPSTWEFDKVGVIPLEPRMDLLTLTIGSHDPETQDMANKIRPVGVFNLSITPSDVVEETHQRLKNSYHPDGGAWRRDHMPRTCLIFVDKDAEKAKQQAESAWGNYWKAMEGTLDPQKVERAVENAIYGDPKQVIEAINSKYHPEDRLMLWFDFNNHDNEHVKANMELFMKEVAPHLKGSETTQ